MEAFQQFVGHIVRVVESKRTIGEEEYTEHNVAPDDETIALIKKVAAEEGLKFRVWLPGTRGTMDHRTDRINIHVDESDGVYKVTRTRIG